MIIVSTKPTAQTQYKCIKPKNVSSDSAIPSKSTSGCLAWFPASKFQPNSDPLLAFSWGNYLNILKITVVPSAITDVPSKKRRSERDIRLEFIKMGEWKGMSSIVGIQWLSSQESEHSNIRQRSLVYHDRFSSLLKDLSEDSTSQIDSLRTSATMDLAYYHSLQVYKGKVFLL
ncbi:16398_t:CDS:2, partial [Racocetra persica]